MNTVQIKTADFSDINALEALWKQAFDDPAVVTASFYENVFEPRRALVAKCDDCLYGMLYLLEASLRFNGRSYSAGYIYAVATKDEFRWRGVMTALLRAAEELGKMNGIELLFLLPEGKPLFSIYERFGFHTVGYQEKSVIVPQYMPAGDYSLCTCEREVFLSRRDVLLHRHPAFFDLAGKARDGLFEQLNLNGEVLFYREAQACGYLAGERVGDEYHIRETDLTLNAAARAAYVMMIRSVGIKRVTVSGLGRRTPYAMAKPLSSEINPFDLAKANTYVGLLLN